LRVWSSEMEYLIREPQKSDTKDLTGIFNAYADTWATFFDKPISEDEFSHMQKEAEAYPFLVAELKGRPVGFGLLRPFHFSPLMRRTAMTSYFLRPEQRGQGLGSMLLDALERAAVEMGIDNLVAPIVSQNTASLSFHESRGFKRCGLVNPAGRMFEQDFGVVFMQKGLTKADG
jgi:L-amino acid N-acyltransferase YncA